MLMILYLLNFILHPALAIIGGELYIHILVTVIILAIP
jgi:hypothetical protein